MAINKQFTKQITDQTSVENETSKRLPTTAINQTELTQGL